MNVTSANFGLLIAYVIPGFVILWGLSFHSPTIQGWLGAAPSSAPTVGGFLYVTLGSVGAGLVASTLRWLIIDTIHHKTGVRPPRWDFGRLSQELSGFQVLLEGHYRYYQAYGGSFIAVLIGDVLYELSQGWHGVGTYVGILALEAVLWTGSRDTIVKFYRRGEMLLARGRRRSGGAKVLGDLVEVDEGS